MPLQAKDDKATAEPGEPVTLNPIANDDGDQLDPASVRLIAPDGSLVTELSVPGQGTWTVHADGTITFTPEEGFSGVAEARYQVTDVLGQRTTAAISVTVAGPDSPTDPTKPTDPTDPTDPAKPADPKPRPTPSTPAAPAPTTPAPTPQPTSPKSTSSGPSALAWTGTEAGVLGLFGGVLVGLGTMLQVLRRRRRA